jgi:hypothetical protein
MTWTLLELVEFLVAFALNVYTWNLVPHLCFLTTTAYSLWRDGQSLDFLRLYLRELFGWILVSFGLVAGFVSSANTVSTRGCLHKIAPVLCADTPALVCTEVLAAVWPLKGVSTMALVSLLRLLYYAVPDGTAFADHSPGRSCWGGYLTAVVVLFFNVCLGATSLMSLAKDRSSSRTFTFVLFGLSHLLAGTIGVGLAALEIRAADSGMDIELDAAWDNEKGDEKLPLAEERGQENSCGGMDVGKVSPMEDAGGKMV